MRTEGDRKEEERTERRKGEVYLFCSSFTSHVHTKTSRLQSLVWRCTPAMPATWRLRPWVPGPAWATQWEHHTAWHHRFKKKKKKSHRNSFLPSQLMLSCWREKNAVGIRLSGQSTCHTVLGDQRSLRLQMETTETLEAWPTNLNDAGIF